MRLLNTKPISRNLGLYIISTSLFSLFLSIAFSYILLGFISGSELSFISLIPAMIIMLTAIIFTITGVVIGYRFYKGKSIKKNTQNGKLILIFSTAYFLYSLFSFFMSNISGNVGGWLRPVIGLLILIIVFPIGIAVKNGTR
jgi:hypothetical protein